MIFNFIYSNIYLLYFVITIILALLKILPNKLLVITIFLILGYTYYFIISYLENDAMIKARFLAKDYMQELNISSQEEIDKIVAEYDKLNETGIKTVNYNLMSGTIVKTIILCVICFII